MKPDCKGLTFVFISDISVSWLHQYRYFTSIWLLIYIFNFIGCRGLEIVISDSHWLSASRVFASHEVEVRSCTRNRPAGNWTYAQTRYHSLLTNWFYSMGHCTRNRPAGNWTNDQTRNCSLLTKWLHTICHSRPSTSSSYAPVVQDITGYFAWLLCHFLVDSHLFSTTTDGEISTIG